MMECLKPRKMGLARNIRYVFSKMNLRFVDAIWTNIGLLMQAVIVFVMEKINIKKPMASA